ncbi:MAG TPA: SPOR domain-containing protein [Gemmatimonas sp.]|uniref:SPOR domain-containing protein n=1 Tax=Gemmatimonas sp. TaxID=1962908 RepID=UPI002ED9A209
MSDPGIIPEKWEMEGRRLAPLLDSVCAVVIAANDPAISTQVAIGVARAQGQRRRVAIADLLGEAPALEALLTGDDPHGIADSFLYGVSLNKIARPMRDAENVFLMPSGTEPVDHEAVYANDRWRRLAAGFHQVGALLIVVARPSTAGFAHLCGFMGALMPTGESTFPTPPGVPLIAPPAPPPPPPEPTPVPKPQTAKRAREAAQEDGASRRNRILALLLVLGAVAIAIGAMWPQMLTQLPAPIRALMGGGAAVADSSTAVVPRTPMDSAPRPDSTTPGQTPASDSGTVPRDSAVKPASPPMPVENLADSTVAARYAIYFATANTRAAAMPDSKVRALEAVALSPVVESGEQWFRVTVGATASRPEAEALLARLRTEKIIGAGSIVSVPYALRLETHVTPALVPTRLAALNTRGIIAYALRQSDGSASVYTGAFESPTQASALADSLRAVGVAPVLAFRTGRGF